MRPFLTTSLALTLILSVSVAVDRLWLALDHGIPTWDDAYHLNVAVAFRDTFQDGLRITDPDWWSRLLGQATMKPPLGNLLAGVAMLAAGLSADAALWSIVPAIAIMAVSVSWIGTRLFGRSAGLWAAAISLVLPGLVPLRLALLSDLHTVAMTLAALAGLTSWRFARSKREAWIGAIVLGTGLGLGLLAKPTVVLFLLAPTVMLAWHWRLADLGRMALALALAAGIAMPWYLFNVIFLAGSARAAFVDAPRNEGDPMPWTLEAWGVYPGLLPGQLGWPIVLMIVLGGAIALWRRNEHKAGQHEGGLAWLLAFLLGAYVIITLIPNKDSRYITPWLPAAALLAVGLSYGLSSRTGLAARAIMLGVTALATTGQMFALPVLSAPPVARALSTLVPAPARHPTPDTGWPGFALLEAIAREAPLQSHALALLSTTATGNEHTLGYFGRLIEPRIRAREIGQAQRDLSYHAAAFDWFMINTADARNREGNAAALVARIQGDRALAEAGRWPGPEGGDWVLFRRLEPRLRVRPAPDESPEPRLTLEHPESVAPGAEVSVLYRLTGPARLWADGVLLVSWQPEDGAPDIGWRHDHRPGEGAIQIADRDRIVTIEQRLTMRADAPPGRYRAAIELLEPGGDAPVALDVEGPALMLSGPPEPPTALVDSSLDPNSRMLRWVALLRQGPSAFTPLFDDVGRVNTAHPGHSYLDTAERAAVHRLGAARDQGETVELHYQIVLACVLRRRADCAVAGLEAILRIDPDDALAWGYLGFVELVQFHPRRALEAIERSQAAGLALPELRLLRAAALAMRLRLPSALRALDG